MIDDRWRIILRVGLVVLLAFSSRDLARAEESGSSDPLVRTQEVLSKDFVVDKKYRSMEGPMDNGDFYLLKTQEPELLWIVGYSATPVDPGTQRPLSQEFLCHSNLELDLAAHQKLFGWGQDRMSRLFTLSQGQSRIRFPKGFGIPIMSDEAVKFDTMVLNMNSDAKGLQMKHKITVDFIRDRDLKEPLKPLFLIGGMGAKLLEGKDGYFGADPSTPMKHNGAGCSLGIHARDKDLSDAFGDGLGRKFTGHWVVKPGREESHTVQTKLWSVPFDTTIHYANVHLHPFAESLELRDATTGQTVFKSQARQMSRGIGLEHVDDFSSEEGLPFFKDHEYELITVYNNTTPEMQDAMSTLFLYVEDKEFHKPPAVNRRTA